MPAPYFCGRPGFQKNLWPDRNRVDGRKVLIQRAGEGILGTFRHITQHNEPGLQGEYNLQKLRTVPMIEKTLKTAQARLRDDEAGTFLYVRRIGKNEWHTVIVRPDGSLEDQTVTARLTTQFSMDRQARQFRLPVDEEDTSLALWRINTPLVQSGEPETRNRKKPTEQSGPVNPEYLMSPAGEAGPKGRDTYARSLEDIKLSIPANERWIGIKPPGKPVRAPDGRRFLEHDLNTKTGPMHITQAALDKAWADAIAVTGPAASRAIAELQEKGFTMKPPPEAHWKAAENLPNKDRLWYEISSEAMSECFPDFSREELGITMDVTAATSPLADPNYNARLAISILAEDFQKTPSVTPAVVQTSVKDALMGDFGKAEQRKVGSFGGTFRFLSGLSDEPPLTTNDRQVAAAMGIPDSAFGAYPVLYELQSRFGNNLRDHINANGGMNSPFGPFQSHQLQALSWVEQRAEQRLQRRTNITEEEAFNGDAYASAFKLAAADLREADIDVPMDPTTGLPRFTASVLSDPRVQQILTPPGTQFLKSTIQTMELNTKLREDGKKFSEALEESKKLGITGNISLAEQVLQRAAKALTQRTVDKVDKSIKLPSPLSKLASVFGAANADISRIEFGRGTFQGDVSPNVRIPMDAIPEKYRPAFMAVLGKRFYQAAQAASRFISVGPAQAQSYSIWMHGKGTMDGLENLAQGLTNIGHEANISQRPNGVLIDVHPKFTDQGPVAVDPAALKGITDDILGKGNSSVIPREYESIYLEEQEYNSTILKARKDILNEHAEQFSKAASISLGDSKNSLRGDANRQVGASAVPLNRRAEKIRDSYRQRIDQLQSSEKELKSLFRAFEEDTRNATGVMQKRIDAFKARAARRFNLDLGQRTSGSSNQISLGEELSSQEGQAPMSPAGEAMKWAAELTGAKKKTTITGGTYEQGGWLSPDGKLDKRAGDRWRASRHKIAATKRHVDMLASGLVRAVRESRKAGIEVPDDTMNTALGNLDNPLNGAQREEVRRMREIDEEEANALEGAFIAKNREAFKVRQHRALASLPAQVALIIGEMTEHITSLSTTLRDAGFLDKNLMATLTKNLGMYLHRSYEIFDNPKFAEQIRKNTTVMQAAADLIRRQIESRNATELMRQVAEEGGIITRGKGSGIYY